MDRHNKVIIAGFSLLEFYALTVCQQIASALTFMHDKKVVWLHYFIMKIPTLYCLLDATPSSGAS
jgi:hypothetical protein